MVKTVVFVTGPAGAGKSTLLYQLSFGAPALDLDEIGYWSGDKWLVSIPLLRYAIESLDIRFIGGCCDNLEDVVAVIAGYGASCILLIPNDKGVERTKPWDTSQFIQDWRDAGGAKVSIMQQVVSGNDCFGKTRTDVRRALPFAWRPFIDRTAVQSDCVVLDNFMSPQDWHEFVEFAQEDQQPNPVECARFVLGLVRARIGESFFNKYFEARTEADIRRALAGKAGWL
jgi:hypothetical protein